jgi:hypothetical protein
MQSNPETENRVARHANYNSIVKEHGFVGYHDTFRCCLQPQHILLS